MKFLNSPQTHQKIDVRLPAHRHELMFTGKVLPCSPKRNNPNILTQPVCICMIIPDIAHYVDDFPVSFMPGEKWIPVCIPVFFE
jgi:hypothetical protein